MLEYSPSWNRNTCPLGIGILALSALEYLTSTRNFNFNFNQFIFQIQICTQILLVFFFLFVTCIRTSLVFVILLVHTFAWRLTWPHGSSCRKPYHDKKRGEDLNLRPPKHGLTHWGVEPTGPRQSPRKNYNYIYFNITYLIVNKFTTKLLCCVFCYGHEPIFRYIRACTCKPQQTEMVYTIF